MMKWIEVIRLRTAGDDLDKLAADLDLSVSDGDREKEGVEIEVYRHHRLDTDLTVIIRRESKENRMCESALGLRFAHALREYGMVSHSVLRELERENSGKRHTP